MGIFFDRQTRLAMVNGLAREGIQTVTVEVRPGRSRHSREENANKKVAQHGSRTDVEKRDERPFHATDC